MRQSAWEEVKTALLDYRKYDWYIREYEQSILNPWVPSDANAGIRSKGGATGDNSMFNKVYRLGEDQALKKIKFYKATIENHLANSPDWLVDLITIMYFGKEQRKLRPASELVGVGYRKAKEGHNAFMEELARLLGIITF